MKVSNRMKAQSAARIMAASTLLLGLVACEKPVVVSSGTPAVAGQMKFELGEYSVEKLELHEGDENYAYDQAVLAIPVTITNQGEKPYTYSPTHNAPQMNEGSTPLLYVDPGAEADMPPAQKQALQGVLLTKGSFPKQITEPQALGKGESLTDYYLFELPPKGTSGLVFSVPPTWHRGKMPALIRFGYTAKKPKGPSVFALEEAIDFDGVSFTVNSATTTYIKTDDTSVGEGFSTNPLFKISYTIENNRKEAIVYEPNHKAVAGAIGARLSSLKEGAHKRVQFGPTTSPEGQLSGKTSVEPGKSISDYVLFEQPGEDVSSLTLEFPAALFDASGLARVAIDYTHSTPPLPKELEKKKTDDGKKEEEDKPAEEAKK